MSKIVVVTRIASSDIKDKTSLVDARKAIEREMERFKVCEKEAKTKTYSKAGLGQAAKVDPEEKAKQDQRDWLNDQVEALKQQVSHREGGVRWCIVSLGIGYKACLSPPNSS